MTSKYKLSATVNPNKVFFITNDKLDFIISYNDHEYLIAAGTAHTYILVNKNLSEKLLR
ncbi:MAG: hypothetical protein IPL26_17090 [Leptospiraceae bacterium]|nr:hypothetical protein [Leptospiraceae bacterium]